MSNPENTYEIFETDEKPKKKRRNLIFLVLLVIGVIAIVMFTVNRGDDEVPTAESASESYSSAYEWSENVPPPTPDDSWFDVPPPPPVESEPYNQCMSPSGYEPCESVIPDPNVSINDKRINALNAVVDAQVTDQQKLNLLFINYCSVLEEERMLLPTNTYSGSNPDSGNDDKLLLSTRFGVYVGDRYEEIRSAIIAFDPTNFALVNLPPSFSVASSMFC